MEFEGSPIDRLLGKAVEAETFIGVCAAIVDRDRVLYEAAAGDATTETMFRNASMTKAPATVAALQLLEQGRLDLETTVESILPEFGQLQVLDGFDGDTPRLRAPASKATVRQLMTHTAGCGYFFGNADLYRYAQATGLPGPMTGLRKSLMGPLARDPGTQWEYGVNTDWLGLVVEAVSGQTLDVYLAEHVYGPLGMTDSTFAPSDEQRARLMPIMSRTADGKLAPTELDLAADWEWAAAGHGSYGTIGDYGRFIRAMLRGGELDGARILDQSTVELAFTDHLHGVPLPDGMKSAEPSLANDIPALPVPQGWGLGFRLVSVDLPDLRSGGTGDWAGIFNCYYWIDRAVGVGAVLMTQVLPFYDARIVETLLGFEAATYAQLRDRASLPQAAGPA
jgi:methyl acetate hydrolase